MCQCSHIWVVTMFAHPDDCGDHRPEPAQEKQKAKVKKQKMNLDFFHVEELPIKQNFKENREKPKANFIYLLQRHRGRSDSVKAAYGVWRVRTPF